MLNDFGRHGVVGSDFTVDNETGIGIFQQFDGFPDLSADGVVDAAETGEGQHGH